MCVNGCLSRTTAPLQVLREGKTDEVYNIGGGQECTNLELARLIVEAVGASKALIQVVYDRPAHDRRDALNTETMVVERGWRPQVSLAAGLARTVGWYC
jgi:dTDP-glucose 4,6-dehydratase